MTCKPDFRICADGTAYLICWGLHGSNGVVPLSPNGGRWTAKTAFWANQDYIRRIFDDEGCSIFGDLVAVPVVDWGEGNE